MANKNESSNSTMITLVVIVIIALGILFFLKPFGGSVDNTPRDDIRKTTIETDQDYNLDLDRDAPPSDNTPNNRNPNDLRK